MSSQPTGRARQRAAAQQRDTKAGTLFIAKADNLNGLRQPFSLLMQAVNDFNGRQHPSIPS